MALIKLNNQSLTNVTSAGLPSGTVLQVTQAAFTGSQYSTTSTSYVSTPVTHNITPASTNSKILVILSGGHLSYYADGEIYIKVVRTIGATSTDVSSATNWSRPSVGGTAYGFSTSGNYLDSPSTTSQVTYTVHIKSRFGAQLVLNSSDYLLTMTLMEIAG
jgi:hypothetical protein